MEGWKGWIDGWTKLMFVSHGETVDGSVNDLKKKKKSQPLSFLKIKLQIDIQDNECSMIM